MRVATQGPGDHPGAAGLLPVPAQDARAFQSRGMVSGSPGTSSVPAPIPGGVPQQWNRALHRSSDAPPAWFPSVYYETGPLEHAPVSVLSDNQMPVPAVDPRGTPARLLRPAVFLGQTQVANPKVSAVFPSLGS